MATSIHPPGGPDGPPRVVSCPSCGKPAVYGPQNRWRPFCSERCRGVDLGAWASERYRVASAPSRDEDDSSADGS